MTGTTLVSDDMHESSQRQPAVHALSAPEIRYVPAPEMREAIFFAFPARGTGLIPAPGGSSACPTLQ